MQRSSGHFYCFQTAFEIHSAGYQMRIKRIDCDGSCRDLAEILTFGVHFSMTASSSPRQLIDVRHYLLGHLCYWKITLWKRSYSSLQGLLTFRCAQSKCAENTGSFTYSKVSCSNTGILRYKKPRSKVYWNTGATSSEIEIQINL